MLKKIIKKVFFKLTRKGGYFFVKRGGLFIKDLITKFYEIPKKKSQESINFVNAVKKYQLTQSMLDKKRESLVKYSIFYLGCGVLIFFYGCYFLSQMMWYSLCLCWVISVLLFSLAFRAHFWSYQIREKKLGCSVRTWALSLLKGVDDAT